MSNIQFQGIVAVGSSLPQAVSRYRLLAMGKGVEGFVDKANNVAFISNASADTDKMFNPANGNMDLEQSHEVLSGLQFEAKAGSVHEAYHFHCESGCGTHVMFDSESYVKNCPVCATSLSATADEDEDTDLTDEELDDLEVTDEDEDDLEDDEDSEEDADADESDEDEEELEEDEEEPADEELDEEEEELDDESDDSDEELDDEELDDDSDEEEESEEDDVDEDAPLVIAAATRDDAIAQYTRIRSRSMKATASDVRTVDYKVCASDEGCGAHIVSELSLERCPKNGCNSLLQEPGQTQAAIASSATPDEDEDGDDEEVSMSVLDEENAAEANAIEGTQTQEEVTIPAEDAPTPEPVAPSEEPPAEDAPTPTPNDPAPAETQPQEDPAPESQPAPTQENQTSESSEDDEEDEEGDEITVDALEDLDDDASVDDIDLSPNEAVAGQRCWTAYHKGMPIAVANASTVRPDHKGLVGEQRFGTATAAAMKIGGAKKMLIEMGFKGVKHSLNVPKHVERRAAALATQAEEQMNQEQEEYTARLQAAMATAMVGITRGSFKGETNPVREALCNTLATVGVRSPEIVVDNALRTAFEPFLRQVMARAADIMSKPIEVQQALANTVMDMSYMPQAATASSGSGLESRLGNLGTVTASADVAQATQPEKTDTAVVTAGSDDFSARLQSVIGSLGRR